VEIWTHPRERCKFSHLSFLQFIRDLNMDSRRERPPKDWGLQRQFEKPLTPTHHFGHLQVRSAPSPGCVSDWSTKPSFGCLCANNVVIEITSPCLEIDFGLCDGGLLYATSKLVRTFYPKPRCVSKTGWLSIDYEHMTVLVRTKRRANQRNDTKTSSFWERDRGAYFLQSKWLKS